MAGEVGTGIAGGAMSGASIGTSILPGWGTAIGAVVGGIAGGISGSKVKKDREKADAAAKAVQMEDPAQVAYLARVRRQERQQRAATDPSSAFASMNARNTLGQTQANILRASGGNAQQGINGMLNAQNNTNQAIMGIGVTAGQRADTMLQFQGGLIDNIAQRRLDLQKDNRNQLQREYVAGRQNLNNVLSQGIGLVPDIAADMMPNLNTDEEPTAQPEGAFESNWRTQGTGNISRQVRPRTTHTR